MTLLLWTRIFHFFGLALWLSGLVAMATRSPAKPAGILADVGATLAILTGIYNAVKLSFFGQPWLHIKLGLVAVLIGLHVTLRRKHKTGSPVGAGLLAAVLVVAFLILYVIEMRPLAR